MGIPKNASSLTLEEGLYSSSAGKGTFLPLPPHWIISFMNVPLKWLDKFKTSKSQFYLIMTNYKCHGKIGWKCKNMSLPSLLSVFEEKVDFKSELLLLVVPQVKDWRQLLCISTSFRVLAAPESWSKHMFWWVAVEIWGREKRGGSESITILVCLCLGGGGERNIFMRSGL